MLGYKLFSDNENNVENITVVLDDITVLSADSTHGKFNAIKEAVLNSKELTDEQLSELFNPAEAITNRFAKVSTELSIRGNDLYYEGEKLEGVLADKIVQLFDEDLDYGPFVKFLEKLKTNPEPHSVENLYRWLVATNGFTIASDGDIIGYKYLNSDRTSMHAGDHVIRNGVPLPYGNVLNEDGDVIEMDRLRVQADPAVGCSYGLHVGTWNYVANSNMIVKVKVNPKYVVSVPTECSDQKMRVCRYEVLWQVTEPVASSYDDAFAEEESDWDGFTDQFVESDAPASEQAEFPNDEDPVFNDVEVDAVPEDDEATPPYYYDDVPTGKKFSELRDYPGMNGVPTFYDPSQIVMNLQHKTDTRNNYKTQRRGPDGRFLPKS